MKIFLVSSCLLGLKTRYDGRIVTSFACKKCVKGAVCIPVCPEQLGGLPTPRAAADLIGGDGYDVIGGRSRVVTKDGLDVTANFILGAEQVLAIARRQEIEQVIFKAGSPSCGLTPRIGVAAAMLQSAGYLVEELS